MTRALRLTAPLARMPIRHDEIWPIQANGHLYDRVQFWPFAMLAQVADDVVRDLVSLLFGQPKFAVADFPPNQRIGQREAQNFNAGVWHRWIEPRFARSVQPLGIEARGVPRPREAAV